MKKSMLHIVVSCAVLVIAAVVTFSSASAKDKGEDHVQYVPPRTVVLSGVLVGSEIDAAEVLTLSPVEQPAGTKCGHWCFRRASVLVRLSTAGTDGREENLGAGAYNASVDYFIQGKTGVSIHWQRPTSGDYTTALSSTATTKHSDQLLHQDITDLLGKTCGETAGTIPSLIRFELSAVNFDMSCPQVVKDSLRLYVEVQVEYGIHPFSSLSTFHFTAGSASDSHRPTSILAGQSGRSTTISDNPVPFEWDYTACEATAMVHEVQVLRLFNTYDSYRTTSKACSTTVDWSKAQKVYVYGNEDVPFLNMNYTIAEGSGWYVWRVRPIGNYYTGGIANDSNYGAWNDHVANGAIVDFNNTTVKVNGSTVSSGTTRWHSLFYYEQFDADKNWKFERMYSEDRNGGSGSSESILFATSLLQPIQKQMPVQSTNSALVQQTVLDYNGRGLLNTLVSPKPLTMSGVNNLAYKTLVATNGSRPYRAEDFDADNKVNDPAQMTGLAASYYGTALLGTVYTADDQGYPFTRTLSTPDPLVRPLEKGGPGDVLRLRPSNSHTVKVLYSSVSEKELVSVFGCEAPSPEFTYKTITRDQNGVISYTYYRYDDKAIATCLSAATSTPSLVDLSNNTVHALTLIDTTKNGLNIRKDSIYQSRTLEVLTATSYSFAYSITKPTYGLACPEICKQCDYEVTVRVRNVATNVLEVDETYTYNEANCPGGTSSETVATVTLQPGTYLMERSMRPRPTTVSLPTLALDVVKNTMRTDRQTLVEQILLHNLVGSGGDADDLEDFRKGLSGTPTKEQLDEREAIAERLLGRYKSLMTTNRSPSYADTTLGCCTMQWPVVTCINGCEDPPPDYEAMLISAYNALPAAKKTALRGTTSNITTIDQVMWLYGGTPITCSAGSINTLMANMITAGYSCKEIYTCWKSLCLTLGDISVYPLPGGTTFKKHPAFSPILYFIDCAGTQYCEKIPITESVTGGQWLLYAWQKMPQPNPLPTPDKCWDELSALYVDFTCTGDAEHNAAVNQHYRDLRDCYKNTWITEAMNDDLSDAMDEYTDEDVSNSEDDEPTTEEIRVKFDELEEKCKAKCNGSYEMFVDSLVRMHIREGRTIVERPDLIPTVTIIGSVHMSNIYCAAGAMRDECLAQCDLTYYDPGVDPPTGPTEEELKRVSLITSANSIRVLSTPEEGCPETGLWTHVERYTKVADFIIEAMNRKLKEFRDAMTTDVAYWDIQAAFKQLQIENPELPICEIGLSDGPNWWGTLPPGTNAPNNRGQIGIEKKDPSGIQKFIVTGSDCQIRFIGKKRGRNIWYTTANPHPIVHILNDYLTSSLGKTVTRSRFTTDFTTVDSVMQWTGVEPIKIYTPHTPVAPMTGVPRKLDTDPLKPTFADVVGPAFPAPDTWPLRVDDIGCVNGDEETLEILETFLPIKSRETSYIGRDIDNYIYTTGTVEIQGCFTGTYLTRIFASISFDSAAKSFMLKINHDGVAQMFDIGTKELPEILKPGILSDYIRFEHGEDDMLHLVIQDKSLDWYGARDVLFPCVSLRCYIEAPTWYWPDTCNVYLCNTCATVQCADVCYRWVQADTIEPTSAIRSASCAEEEVQRIITTIESQLYGPCFTSKLDELDISYHNNCFNPSTLVDAFTASRGESVYHYTLYYYDRAGNLAKTVPPAGVNFSNSRTRNDCVDHTYETRYNYNTLGQLKASITPDGGTTNFWYNAAGMVRLSQNAKQTSSGKFSYVDYDALGRVIETGERTPGASGDASVASYPMRFTSGTGTNIIKTIYTQSSSLPAPWNTKVQRNLLNRISEAICDRDGNLSTLGDQYTTFYSYDEHGNVEWTINELPQMRIYTGTRLGILVEYEYDLVSGQLAAIRQQRGYNDQVLREYEYDSEGRITESHSSIDGWLWDRDALYEYYPHGSVSRIQLGRDSVQGVDYAYTLSGWLKGINSTNIIPGDDPGGDGNAGVGIHPTVGHDAFGMTLHYHDNDFVATGSVFTHDAADNRFRVRPLYNGNISGLTWNSRNVETSPTVNPPYPIGARYRYDQVNRLMGDSLFPHNGTAWQVPGNAFWQTEYTYDPNGNIKTLKRNDGSGTEFDNLEYSYPTGTPNNKLRRVKDYDVTTGTHPNDIEDQVNTDNYTYDASGNVTANIAENISSIYWTPTNKVDSIVTSTNRIAYSYDALGNRVRQSEYDASNNLVKNTWYVRNPKGDLLSVYTQAAAEGIKLVEVPLYGSERLGVISVDISDINSTKDTVNTSFGRYSGIRRYELNDHLGNVRAVVSDEVAEIASGSYAPFVLAKTDYYPFGMAMETRTENADDYRFGFNGKENDNAVMGLGNSSHFEFREYDTRLGRFTSVDPKSQEYVWQSPYVYHRNNPVNHIDYLGLGDPPQINWDYFESRHMLSGDFSASTPKGGVTSVVVKPEWQSRTIIEGFFDEAMTLGQQSGKTVSDVTLKNGTTWNINIKNGHFYPVGGDGIVNLSNSEVKALKGAKHGANGELVFESLAKNKSLGTFSKQMEQALESLAKIEGVSPGKVLKHVGGKMSSFDVKNRLLSDAAKAKFGPGTKFVKWGGRALLVVAIAADVYEVYNSENKARTITTKVGGWTAGLASASATGAGLTATGIDFTGPWGWAAHGLITIGAGVGGYFAGEYITEKVYDLIFSPVK